ncbi:cation/H+ exchanger [Pholiota conissans]|uniref:Cation/H+ exchanger n=1 Tax=Pholiota conissans TaxID=109636 RepID=A0A9P5Z930_9AGAR|nr:cation/H+ exchanger [Pholiota conissans]
MGEFTSQVVGLFSRAAAAQGGIISGDNPTQYNKADPLRLWIIQLVIIICVTQLLGLLFARIRQPRVIAEVIGGVILGPSVMGHIPHFRNAIFPLDSIPLLTLTANIGLVLFLFMVALEIDTRLLKRNVLAAASISIAGLVVPLGLGAALGVAVYREFVTDPNISFGNFLLFVAVAVGITAFPVLCRILAELKLLDTEVGLVVLSAGIGNDVVGWILLALTVALVNASSGLTALWVLLASTGYVLLLLFPGRWAFRWLAIRTGSLEKGSPTPLLMTVALILVFISAFFTDIIGVHAIFGGFLAGLVIPHDNGLSLAVLEKIEDLVYIVFLPLYFTLSGLNTNLSLLNNGVTWGYVFLICTVALLSKFIACGATAYLNGFNWRESGAIGSLMSCKGLVELIVLNIGLSANILDPRTFSMFVLHAIFVTVMTTPLVLLFYPAKYRKHFKQKSEPTLQPKGMEDDTRTKFALVLDRMEALPSAMTLSQLLQAPFARSSNRDSIHSSVNEKFVQESSDNSLATSSQIIIEALRLIEMTNRTSTATVIKSQEAESLIHNDPILSTYRTFGQLNELSVSANVSVVSADEFPEAIANHVSATNSQMVIIPWARGMTSVTEEGHTGAIGTRNPFDGIFHKTVTTEDQTGAVVYSEFIRNVFAKSPSDIALFVDRGLVDSSGGSNKQHLFLPFMGGPDDRLALSFLVQLCGRSSVTATVVKIVKTDHVLSSNLPKATEELSEHVAITNTAADTVYPQLTTETRMTSGLADNLLWDRYALPSAHQSPEITAALSRITFRVESTPTPLRHITDMAKQVAGQSKQISSKTMIIIAGRSRRLAVESLRLELKKLTTDLGSNMSASLPTTLGDIGAALVTTNVNGSLLIVQAASPSKA